MASTDESTTQATMLYDIQSPESTLSFGEASTPPAAAAPAPCEECVGSGGWFRYEPALDPAPGLLYLSCLQCRGSGRLSLPRG